MPLARALFGFVFSLLASSCAYQTALADVPPTVPIQQLISSPDEWDDKTIRVEGWGVKGFENHNLFATRFDACTHKDEVAVVGVDWGADSIQYGNMRHGVFEGVFRNRLGVMRDGQIVISTGSASPGPLEVTKVIAWKSESQAVCKTITRLEE